MSTIEPTQDSEEWQTTDDYGPAWRNPRFQAATSTETGPVHQPQMGRDGGESDALGRDGGVQ